jgi:5'-nucleotidase
MRQFLLTNDDGIDAPGLAALGQSLAGLGEGVVFAPDRCWSSQGHAVSTNRALRFEERGQGRWAIEGSPADCVRFGLQHARNRVDWVLSGINAGGNLGTDLAYSGTVAAAREAALRGCPAVAFSHYLRRDLPLRWDRASRWTAQILALLIDRGCEPGWFWNVNFPHLDSAKEDAEIVECLPDRAALPVGYRVEGNLAYLESDYHARPRGEATDVDHCFGGRITISRIRAHD